MDPHTLSDPGPNPGDFFAGFGDAALMKHADGKYELIGGSPADRAEALRWIARYIPNERITGLTPEELLLLAPSRSQSHRKSD